MQRTDLQDTDYEALLSRIVPIMLSNGLKSTTMDNVAAELGMSKRTLYEIFGSKSDMLREALEQLERQSRKYYVKVFEESDNIMEALFKVFKYNRDLTKDVNPDFYHDMDRLYQDKRKEFDQIRAKRHEEMLKVYKIGVDQGMFRPDADYPILSRMMGIQMEALKRNEELFSSEISLQRVFDAIIVGHLRSIASEKGMRILDKLTNEIKK